jgi:hypothetical protein
MNGVQGTVQDTDATRDAIAAALLAQQAGFGGVGGLAPFTGVGGGTLGAPRSNLTLAPGAAGPNVPTLTGFMPRAPGMIDGGLGEMPGAQAPTPGGGSPYGLGVEGLGPPTGFDTISPTAQSVIDAGFNDMSNAPIGNLTAEGLLGSAPIGHMGPAFDALGPPTYSDAVVGPPAGQFTGGSPIGVPGGFSTGGWGTLSNNAAQAAFDAAIAQATPEQQATFASLSEQGVPAAQAAAAAGIGTGGGDGTGLGAGDGPAGAGTPGGPGGPDAGTGTEGGHGGEGS